jgi:outer membrane protein OmpA-like peptidoglycan-associated protein
MRFNRNVPLVASLFLIGGASSCGGVTQFASAQPVTITGTPPPPPAPPPPPPVAKEEPKPPPRVELRDNKIEFKEKIQFQVNKATIKEESFSLLHDIAEVIKKNPHVKKISIEGHASAEGDAKRNKKLSDERAKSVMAHLVSKEGVEADRLTSVGWGIDKPIASNDNEEGREKNRRVEFLVTKQDIVEKKVEIDAATGKEKVVDEKKHTYEAPQSTPAADTSATKGAAPKNPETPKQGDANKPEVKK